MIPAKPLGIQNYLLPSKPLGSDRRLSTVFLPEDFAAVSSDVEIMELSSGISPEIVSDFPGSNKSLVPMSKKDFGSVSTHSELPNSWSSLADLVENSLENIPEEEIIFTPTGFQRQNPDLKSNQRQSSGASFPPEDTYAPSVTQAVTLTSPYFASEPELPENLDAIARAVYRRIIDRLQIERERNGRSYSGRLPW